MKKISFLAVILLLSVSAFAILPPGNIQAAFKKMYPKANGIAGRRMMAIIALTLL